MEKPAGHLKLKFPLKVTEEHRAPKFALIIPAVLIEQRELMTRVEANTVAPKDIMLEQLEEPCMTCGRLETSIIITSVPMTPQREEPVKHLKLKFTL